MENVGALSSFPFCDRWSIEFRDVGAVTGRIAAGQVGNASTEAFSTEPFKAGPAVAVADAVSRDQATKEGDTDYASSSTFDFHPSLAPPDLIPILHLGL